MRIIITNDEDNLGIIKDFSDLDFDHFGLIGQTVMELENLKQELILIYNAGGIDKMGDDEL